MSVILAIFVISWLFIPVECWFITYEDIAEESTNLKLCVLLHISPPETIWMFEIYGKAALKETDLWVAWQNFFPEKGKGKVMF